MKNRLAKVASDQGVQYFPLEITRKITPLQDLRMFGAFGAFFTSRKTSFCTQSYSQSWNYRDACSLHCRSSRPHAYRSRPTFNGSNRCQKMGSQYGRANNVFLFNSCISQFQRTSRLYSSEQILYLHKN